MSNHILEKLITYKMKIVPIGNSYGVRFPKRCLDILGLKNGDPLVCKINVKRGTSAFQMLISLNKNPNGDIK